MMVAGLQAVDYDDKLSARWTALVTDLNGRLAAQMSRDADAGEITPLSDDHEGLVTTLTDMIVMAFSRTDRTRRRIESTDTAACYRLRGVMRPVHASSTTARKFAFPLPLHLQFVAHSEQPDCSDDQTDSHHQDHDHHDRDGDEGPGTAALRRFVLRTAHSSLGGRSISGRHPASGFETRSVRGIRVLRVELGRVGILVSHTLLYPIIDEQRLDFSSSQRRTCECAGYNDWDNGSMIPESTWPPIRRDKLTTAEQYTAAGSGSR
ncbi:hypothetical protein Y013_03865 [Rhodococcus pyridinivorans SB3094]|uniref:Uncharacterized protein n=1 Tax=Rhodococcus pyridinivorans SB3094 TaxID=1435356 RepID=V9XJH7_9NOCA|nr:hypothetical protein Y013_03865 [Rhodococcus pyridinivorans SB3094]